MIKIGAIGDGFSAQTFHIPSVKISQDFTLQAITTKDGWWERSMPRPYPGLNKAGLLQRVISFVNWVEIKLVIESVDGPKKELSERTLLFSSKEIIYMSNNFLNIILCTVLWWLLTYHA